MKHNIYKVEFSIRTLLLLEEELNVPLDSILFDVEITEDIQKAIFYYGVRRSTKFGRTKLYEQYDNLTSKDKLLLNMKVNGKLLDSFGVGKQQGSSEVSQETKFFAEYMIDFMHYMIGAVGMSKEEFLSCTPAEVFSIADAYRKEQEFQFKLNQLAHINAIGLTSSKKFKEINPFEKQTSKVKKISKEDKEKELDFLFNKVGDK